MTRTMYRDYAFEAYARSRAKRDRGKREGPDHQNGAGARDTDQLGGKISFQNTKCERDLQLDDADWFKKFPRAGVRLRNIVADDDVGDAAAELLSIVVSRGAAKPLSRG